MGERFENNTFKEIKQIEHDEYLEYEDHDYARMSALKMEHRIDMHNSLMYEEERQKYLKTGFSIAEISTCAEQFATLDAYEESRKLKFKDSVLWFKKNEATGEMVQRGYSERKRLKRAANKFYESARMYSTFYEGDLEWERRKLAKEKAKITGNPEDAIVKDPVTERLLAKASKSINKFLDKYFSVFDCEKTIVRADIGQFSAVAKTILDGDKLETAKEDYKSYLMENKFISFEQYVTDIIINGQESIGKIKPVSENDDEGMGQVLNDICKQVAKPVYDISQAQQEAYNGRVTFIRFNFNTSSTKNFDAYEDFVNLNEINKKYNNEFSKLLSVSDPVHAFKLCKDQICKEINDLSSSVSAFLNGDIRGSFLETQNYIRILKTYDIIKRNTTEPESPEIRDIVKKMFSAIDRYQKEQNIHLLNIIE